mmetsp:Transcript_21378/g.49732  ORF Transcript_21378/g.49732 Transcript_21378/m.49732 type:complete len:479 (-) Transcript_21378:141-1577(-)
MASEVRVKVKAFAVAAAVLGISFTLSGCGDGPGGGGDLGNGKPNYINYSQVGFRSMSWCPLWLLDESCIEEFSPVCQGPFANSDVSADWGATLWSAEGGGRGDLMNIKMLGGNTIRLYGNDPRMSKAGFFNYARKNGMQVAEGLTGWLYNQGGGPMCATAQRQETCHDAVKNAFQENLLHGFMEGKYYHNAISIINLANEPDFFGVPGAPEKGANYLWAMVSAFDGLLSAEKAAGVQPWEDGSLPRITCTWSYSNGRALGEDICKPEYGILDRSKECGPGLAFMVQFARVIADPEKYVGYTPQNDLAAAFRTRWINTVQLFVHAEQVEREFLEPYMKLEQTKDIPVVATEWDTPPFDKSVPMLQDLRKLESMRTVHPNFWGVSFFQYQVAYEKGGPEREYGLFGLGRTVIGHTKDWYINGDYGKAQPINCLTKKASDKISALAKVWGGSEPTEGLCPSDAASYVVQEDAASMEPAIVA